MHTTHVDSPPTEDSGASLRPVMSPTLARVSTCAGKAAALVPCPAPRVLAFVPSDSARVEDGADDHNITLSKYNNEIQYK